jgi:hypothetical protein
MKLLGAIKVLGILFVMLSAPVWETERDRERERERGLY